jgi:hypothetical protein
MKFVLAYYIIKIGCGCVNIFGVWLTQSAQWIACVRARVGGGIKFNAGICCFLLKSLVASESVPTMFWRARSGHCQGEWWGLMRGFVQPRMFYLNTMTWRHYPLNMYV